LQLIVQALSAAQLAGHCPPMQLMVHWPNGAQVGLNEPWPRWFMVHRLSAPQVVLPPRPSMFSVHRLRSPPLSMVSWASYPTATRSPSLRIK